MIKLEFDKSVDQKLVYNLAKEKGLSLYISPFVGIVPSTSEIMSIVGNSAQVVALLLTLYQMYGNSKRINYHSEKHDQKNINLDKARELAEQDE